MIANDLRYAWQALFKRPLFSMVVVFTLGLGIGVNSAVFSVLNALLFSTLSVESPQELVNVYTTDSTRRGRSANSYSEYVHVRDNARTFNGVLAYSGLMTTITGHGTPEVVFGEMVSGNYFAVTGARMALGRAFVPEEDVTPGTHPVVVLGHRLWQRRFHGDSAIVGTSIMLNGHAFTVVGVADRSFNGLMFRGLSADLWAPVMMMGELRTDQLTNRDERWLFVKGRLARGSGVKAAAVELKVLGSQLSAAFPASNGARTFDAVAANSVRINPDSDGAVLSGAVIVLILAAFIVLIACTNLANLLLARGAARRREIAVRLALGATRLQLVRQLSIESALLAVIGGAVGLAIGVGLARLVVAYRPPTPFPISLSIAIDWRVLAFTFALTLAASLVFGLFPAFQSTRGSMTAGLSAHDAAPRGVIARLRHAFLIPQLALSLALLVLAGLFVRSVANAGNVNPGFDIERTAMLALDLKLDGYDTQRAARFYETLQRNLMATPGVRAVTITDRIPLDLYGNLSTSLHPVQSNGSKEEQSIQMAHVDETYFSALGIRMQRGRGFTGDERRANAPVAIISEQAASQYFPRSSAIGQYVRVGDDHELLEIVGVATNVKVQTLGEAPQPFIYRPLALSYTPLLRVVVNTDTDAGALAVQLRSMVAQIDPNVAVFESTTMAKNLDVMLFPYRLAARAASALGVFGLVLATMGLYGVVAFGVARRVNEFGIRMALGAQRADILRLVMRGTLRVATIGLAGGLVLALVIGHVISSLLFGIGGSDPLTIGVVLSSLMAVCVAAAYIPARRAAIVNPAVALRNG